MKRVAHRDVNDLKVLSADNLTQASAGNTVYFPVNVPGALLSMLPPNSASTMELRASRTGFTAGVCGGRQR